MSRTYRDNTLQHWRDPLEEYVDGWEPGNEICYWGWWGLTSWKKVDPKSPQGRKLLAMSKRDKTWRFKEPGPSWFRRLTAQRPYRRECRKILYNMVVHAADYDELENYSILSKPKLDYWT